MELAIAGMGSCPYFILFAYEQAKLVRLHRSGRKTGFMKLLRTVTAILGVCMLDLNIFAICGDLSPTLMRDKAAVTCAVASVCLVLAGMTAYRSRLALKARKLKVGFFVGIAILMAVAMLTVCIELVQYVA